MAQYNMEVSRKEGEGKNKKFVFVGTVPIFVPTLADFGLTAAKVKGTGEDGLPIYEADNDQWLFGAVFAQVKAAARNKLVSGTCQVKDGLAIATSLAELTAESERAGNNALALIREVKALFAKWVAGLGKSAAATNLLLTVFNDRKALAIQPQSTKDKVTGYLADFANTLDEAQLESYGRYIQSLLDTCAAAEDDDEADDF